MKKTDFIINSNYKEVDQACLKFREFCLSEINNQKICDEVEICLTESLNNIIEHGYKEKDGHKIQVSVLIDDADLKIEMRDSGATRTNFDKPKLEFDPADLENIPESGMGLYIIDQLIDETSYKTEDGVNIFTLSKKLT